MDDLKLDIVLMRNVKKLAIGIHVLVTEKKKLPIRFVFFKVRQRIVSGL